VTAPDQPPTWADLTSPEAAAGPAGPAGPAGGWTVLVPLGSVEQHGPHLPLDTDTRIAVAVARRVAASLPGVVVAPAIAYGASGEHQGFAGTLSIGQEALVHVVVELARSAGPEVARVVLVNGHGGNLEALRRAVELLRSEGRDVVLWSPRLEGSDTHAGRAETSMLLALCPEVVRLDRAEPGVTTPLAELLPALREGGLVAVTPNGVLGDPTGASAAIGHELLDRCVVDLADALGPAARGRIDP
jgi:mycofactocin precursor peptide peptidase